MTFSHRGGGIGYALASDAAMASSNLILQGLQRVKFTGFEQETPFPIAKIEPLESNHDPSIETDALSAKVLELYRNL